MKTPKTAAEIVAEAEAAVNSAKEEWHDADMEEVLDIKEMNRLWKNWRDALDVLRKAVDAAKKE